MQAIDSGRNVISFQCRLPERKRIIESLNREIAVSRQVPCYLWNLGQRTLRRVDSRVSVEYSVSSPFEIVESISESAENGLFILEDLHPFLSGAEADMQSRLMRESLRSQLVSLASEWADTRKYAVMLGTQEVELLPNLDSIIPEFWNPLPSYKDNLILLNEFLPQIGVDIESLDIPHLALSAGGLSVEQIKFGLRLVKAKNLPIVQGFLDFKIECFKSFNLQFIPRPSQGNFGGMDRIRQAIGGVKKDYTDEARKRGIPLPKGWLLVGPPGTGKTYVSKFCASILGFPMIAVDTGAIAAAGASYLRRLIALLEASAPAVIYFDEFDKLFPEPGQLADMKQRQILGLLLTWLQDKVSQTFVIATLNRLETLPPELTRVGRFDEIFYVGFPQGGERKDILHLHLARFDERYQNGESPISEKDWRVVISNTVNYTGAELSTIVEKAAKNLFHSGQEIRLNLPELLESRKNTVSLFRRNPEGVLKIENNSRYVATSASLPDTSIFASSTADFWAQSEDYTCAGSAPE